MDDVDVRRACGHGGARLLSTAFGDDAVKFVQVCIKVED
jgi:hypothetical protein